MGLLAKPSSMQLLIVLSSLLVCAVHIRYINKRSLLGGDHHHHHHHDHEEPSDVYLPPPTEAPEPAEPIETTTLEVVAPADSYLVGDTDADAVETTTLEVEAPADSYLVGDTVADTVELKAGDDAVNTEAPIVETEASAKESEVTVVETEATVDATEAPVIAPKDSYIVEQVAPAETTITDAPKDSHIADTATESTQNTEAETEPPIVAPSDTYLVGSKIESTDTDAPIVTDAPTITDTPIVTDAPIDTDAPVQPKDSYIIDTEPPVDEPSDTYLAAEEEEEKEESNAGNTGTSTISAADEYEPTSSEGAPDDSSSVDETVAPGEENPLSPLHDNSVDEPVVTEDKHASGYWIDVSGDQDILVKYHG